MTLKKHLGLKNVISIPIYKENIKNLVLNTL